MKRKTHVYFFTLALGLLLIAVTSNTKSHGNYISDFRFLNEEFDPGYVAQFQSIDDVTIAAEKQFCNNKGLPYFNHVASILRKRFYHGYSYYSPSENFLASSCGLFWNHLSAIVIPDDIMKRPMAACSQQAIVLMEIFERSGIAYRKIGFEGHYVVEAFIDGQWRYFDTNKEPAIMDHRESLESMILSGRFDTIYNNSNLPSALIRKWSSTHEYGNINEEPAPNATRLHTLGFWLQSAFMIPVYILAIIIRISFLRRKRIADLH